MVMKLFVASQDSTGKTVNANAGDWQEETYQKVSSLALFKLFTFSCFNNAIVIRLADKTPERDVFTCSESNAPKS